MEFVINNCIEHKLTKLDLNSMKLTILPKLPNHILQLLCADNQLTELPELPEQLEILVTIPDVSILISFPPQDSIASEKFVSVNVIAPEGLLNLQGPYNPKSHAFKTPLVG